MLVCKLLRSTTETSNILLFTIFPISLTRFLVNSTTRSSTLPHPHNHNRMCNSLYENNFAVHTSPSSVWDRNVKSSRCTIPSVLSHLIIIISTKPSVYAMKSASSSPLCHPPPPGNRTGPVVSASVDPFRGGGDLIRTSQPLETCIMQRILHNIATSLSNHSPLASSFLRPRNPQSFHALAKLPSQPPRR